MRTSCEITPSVKGQPSNLFRDLLKITGDREQTKVLYAYAKQKSVQDLLQLKQFDELGEPKVAEFLESIKDPKLYLNKDNYAKFISKKENLDKPHKTFEDAFFKVEELRRKYEGYAFTVHNDGKQFKINVYNDSLKMGEMKKTLFNGNLQNRLLSILNRLGFDVKIGTTVGTAGRFSGIDARKNAEGLITAIEVAKGRKGEEALPEEFAHLMIEGLHNHPLVIRLLDRLNDELVEQILGDEYSKYKDLYSGNKELLRKEAAGKLLADAILNKSNDPLLQRVYNESKKRLAQGSIREINDAIVDAQELASVIMGDVEEETQKIDNYFDKDAVLDAKPLYKLEEEIKGLAKVAEKAYEVLNKKIKISILSSKVRQDDSAENKAVEEMRKGLESKNYTKSCHEFLLYTINELQRLFDKIEEYKDIYIQNGRMKLNEINLVFKLLREISTSLTAYEDVVQTLSVISKFPDLNYQLKEEDMKEIESKAKDILSIMNSLKRLHKSVNYNAIFEFFRYYWGDDKIIKSMNGKEEYTLEDILGMTPTDMNAVGRLFGSMEDAPYALLTIVDNMFKRQRHLRDNEIHNISQAIKQVHEEYYRATGSRDTSFMYAKDENGKLNGMIISDIDYNKYYKARREYLQQLKEQDLTREEISGKLAAWDRRNTKPIQIGPERYENRPRKDLYRSNDVENLTDAQKKYYYAMMDIKLHCDLMLPTRLLKHHRAVQKRASLDEAILRNANNPQKAIKQIKGKLKQGFVRTVDDTEFGETFDEDGNLIDVNGNKQILLDFAGNPVSKIATPYLKRLDDMDLLSTDFTDSMISYAAMTINYDKMYQISNAMESIKDYLHDIDIQHTAGKKFLYERFKGKNGEIFTRPYTTKGYNSELYKMFEKYLQINLYGKTKEEEILYVNGKEINYGKAGDTMKWYTILLGLGWNIFSFGSNISMGMAQTFIEAMSGLVNKNTFNLKDVGKAIKFYFGHVGGNIGDHYRDIKENKLTLLLQKFDPQEDFVTDLTGQKMARGKVARTLGAFDPLAGMSAGEHFLHSIAMAAYLNHIKVEVEVDGQRKKMSLLDAYKVEEVDGPTGGKIPALVLPENTTLNGKKITEKELFEFKRYIQATAHSLHGAYSQTDKGQVSTYVLGRLLMTYRQWMPAVFMNRFKSKRYNAARGQMEEGFYISFFKFFYTNMQDLFHAKFQIGTRWGQLSNHQKANIVKAVTEMAMFYLLSAILHFDGTPDKDDSMAKNYIRYMGYRLKLELGSTTPSRPMLGNIQTLVNTPIPAMEKANYITNLFRFADMGKTIETGKFAGWNKYVRNLYYATPFARNINRVFEIKNNDFSMFLPYLND